MKKYIIVLMTALMGGINECMAQNSGLGFNYQAVIRKVDGKLLANSEITLRISLYPGQLALNPTWVETHKVTTDVSGCFGVTVGKGIRVNGTNVAATFSDINFAAVYYWMKIEIQESNTFREISFSQLPSSPYSEVAHNAMMPAGMIVPFAGSKDKIPAGWLLCDGSAVSRSKYLYLYDAIGVSWGEGNGSTTFNLPDLRGMFLRGVSGDSGNDEDADDRVTLNDKGGNIGNNVGSYQNDAINKNVINSIKGPLVMGGIGEVSSLPAAFKAGYSTWNVLDISLLVNPEYVGSDNRPKNVYVNYIIKF